jgi:hypothetical protein
LSAEDLETKLEYIKYEVDEQDGPLDEAGDFYTESVSVDEEEEYPVENDHQGPFNVEFENFDIKSFDFKDKA